MTHAPDIRFIGMEPCGAIASVARDRAEALDRTHRGIMSCQIAIAQARQRAGVKPTFSVRVDLLTSGGAEFMARGGSGDSIYEALRDVFDTSVRQLEAAVRHH
jgi:hypothetical protein